jgi:hypothetical protein
MDAMKRVRLLMAVASCVVLLRAVPAAAEMTAEQEEEAMMLAGGAWHAGKFVPCADGTVTDVEPRLETPGVTGSARFESGVATYIRLPTAPKFLNGQPFPTASVVHYDGDPTNKLMESERKGDRVQVCLVSFPTPSHDLQTGAVVCDPNTDPRGMTFRVYDYKRHAAYVGPDSEHGCGGA